MKLIIEIPDNTYADIQEHKRYTDFTILDLIKATRHGIPIPDNATNGDVLKAIFKPNRITRMDDIVREEYDFTHEWWNAPYKKGGKE